MQEVVELRAAERVRSSLKSDLDGFTTRLEKAMSDQSAKAEKAMSELKAELKADLTKAEKAVADQSAKAEKVMSELKADLKADLKETVKNREVGVARGDAPCTLILRGACRFSSFCTGSRGASSVFGGEKWWEPCIAHACDSRQASIVIKLDVGDVRYHPSRGGLLVLGARAHGYLHNCP